MIVLRAGTSHLAEHERKHCFIDHFIRNEKLKPDLLAALELMGIGVPHEVAAGMKSRPRTNTSSKKHGPGYYYDAETERMIGDRDRLIVEKFGYVAPSLRS